MNRPINTNRAIRNRLLAGAGWFFCFYCLDGFPAAQSTLEHIIPRHCGGTWRHSNLTLACHKCNHHRNTLVTCILKKQRISFPAHIMLGLAHIGGEWHFLDPAVWPDAYRFTS